MKCLFVRLSDWLNQVRFPKQKGKRSGFLINERNNSTLPELAPELVKAGGISAALREIVVV
jgi:hypothetical protein